MNHHYRLIGGRLFRFVSIPKGCAGEEVAWPEALRMAKSWRQTTYCGFPCEVSG